MYGREELETFYKTSCTEDTDIFYSKDEADKVMDAMEARIKHLESILDLDPRTNLSLVDENQQLRSRLEDVQNTMATENVDLGMENFKLKERVKELERKNSTDYIEYQRKTQEQAKRIAELEQQLPKWISTDDRLPDISGEYQVVHKSIRGSSRFVTTDIFNARNSQWQRAILPKLHTHWAELLPPPPTTEEK